MARYPQHADRTSEVDRSDAELPRRDPGVHRVSVLLPERVIPLDLVIPLQVFGQWADYVYDVTQTARHPYQVSIAGRPETGCGTMLSAQDVRPLSTLQDADTVIVPGVHHPLGGADLEVVEALRAAHERGARMVSICTGAFLLAAAGILDGRRATTHWAWASDLHERYPAVSLLPEQLYVDDEKVITSAGVLAGVDLCLHILRVDQGQALANTVARYLVSAPHRQGGQAQFIQSPLPPAGDDLGPVLGWVGDNLAEPLTLEVIARRAGLSVRTLSRRFRATTGSSTMEWVISQRVARARTLLETTDLPVSDIAHLCGFGSDESLRTHFTTHTRTSPSRYRQTFR